MGKELTSLDRFETLNKACNSEDSFVQFYKNRLLNKELNIWKSEVRNVFNDINSFLRNSPLSHDISIPVNSRYKMILLLQSKVNALQKEVSINMENHELCQNAPDVLFGEQMEEDILRLNRSYDEVSFVYRNRILERLSLLRGISPFVDACKSMLEEKVSEFRNEFHVYLPSTSDLSKRKFKTSFTVPQLACFFKILYLKDVISEDTKMVLYRTIADNFDTYNTKGGLSENSLKNHFESPDIKTMEYVAALFERLTTAAKKEVQVARK